jgi:ferredoxin
MAHIVFYFSGTGNSLTVAKTLLNELGDGKIVSMAHTSNYTLAEQYDTIGFVFPTYFWGLPHAVTVFLSNLNIGQNHNAYFYVIATCGASSGGALYKANKILKEKQNIQCSYSKELAMFSNYVVMYDMKKNVEEIAKRSNGYLASIVSAVKARANNKVGLFHTLMGLLNIHKDFAVMDRDYNINDKCNGCGICKRVCPVGNIELMNNKPQFNHKCEQCMACIQYCPQKAINYKNVTQNRGRYTNPEIGYAELERCNRTGC